jgi:hypothetical protein
LVSAAVVCAATSAIQKLLMQLASGRPLQRLEGASPAISDRDRAYSALRADSCPLESPLRSARHSPQPHSLSQPRGQERVRALETSQIFHPNLPSCVSPMCASAHMNSRGMPGHPHKCDIKVAG